MMTQEVYYGFARAGPPGPVDDHDHDCLHHADLPRVYNRYDFDFHIVSEPTMEQESHAFARTRRHDAQPLRIKVNIYDLVLYTIFVHLNSQKK